MLSNVRLAWPVGNVTRDGAVCSGAPASAGAAQSASLSQARQSLTDPNTECPSPRSSELKSNPAPLAGGPSLDLVQQGFLAKQQRGKRERHVQVICTLPTARINLSPFTKDYRVGGGNTVCSHF